MYQDVSGAFLTSHVDTDQALARYGEPEGGVQVRIFIKGPL